MTASAYYADLQAACDVLCALWLAQGTIDLTGGFVDITDDHDPITCEVLEDAHAG